MMYLRLIFDLRVNSNERNHNKIKNDAMTSTKTKIDWMENELISWRNEDGFLCDPPEQTTYKQEFNQMSAPAKAKLYDKDNVIVGEVFVNVGWYMCAGRLAKCLKEVIESEQYTPNVTHLEMYGFKFDRQFIEDAKHFTDSDLEYIIKELYNP